MTVARLAALQRQLGRAGLAERVRLLAITYEPQFDTPERLKRHTLTRGFKLENSARAPTARYRPTRSAARRAGDRGELQRRVGQRSWRPADPDRGRG